MPVHAFLMCRLWSLSPETNLSLSLSLSLCLSLSLTCTHTHTYLHIYIYSYTPLPILLTNLNTPFGVVNVINPDFTSLTNDTVKGPEMNNIFKKNI